MTKIIQRLMLVSFGFALFLIMLEIVLQVGALIMDATGREIGSSWMTGNYRLVTLGDSNTYGLHVEAAESFPKQLEATWNEAGRSPALEVLNLGFPGKNSSQVRRELPLVLETFAPDIIIVMVGANDFWTAPVALESSADKRSLLRRFIERNSRILKLAFMLRRSLDRRELDIRYIEKGTKEHSEGIVKYGDVEFAVGHDARTGPISPKVTTDLQQNLEAIAEQAREFGVQVCFLAYFTDNKAYGMANAFVRRAAAAAEVPLIDLEPVFDSICPDHACSDLLFYDFHPRPAGHKVIAEAIADQLLLR
jgi:lysophospholipase L1-like esterase